MPNTPIITPVPVHTPVHTTTTPSVFGAVGKVASGVAINIPLVIGGVAVFFILLIVTFILRSRLKSTQKCDLYVLEVDETKHEITLRCMEKLHENVYINYGRIPTLAVVPKDTHTYTIKIGGKKYKGYLGYTYGYMTLAIDPDLASALFEFSKTNKYAEIENDSIEKMISAMYSLEENTKGKIIIPPSLKITMTFRIHRIMRDILHRVLRRAQTSVTHIYNIMHESDVFSKYVQALTKYREAKFSWMKTLITLIIIIGALALVFSLVHH